MVTGYPTSGKSTRARQLHADFSERVQTPAGSKYRVHLISDQTLSISRAVYDLSPDKLPAHTRSANASEKDARAAISAAVRRALSPRDIVILDGLNYIKGWRYQLYCEAKNLSTPSAVLQIGCSVHVARGINQARLRSRDEGRDAAAAADDEQEGPYEPANWENLVYRYEEPNAMSRWDSPLFALVWEDDDARAKEVFGQLWDSIAGEGRKQVVPNNVAIQKGGTTAGGDLLYQLDRETQDIVKRILELQPEQGGGTLRFSRAAAGGGSSAAEDDLVLELPAAKVVLPQLQRLRRAFLGLNRGGIGLEGAGNMTVARIRESFVRYLGDSFRDEE